MGVLCLSVCFSWLMRGGVTPTAGPISSPSLGRVKWKEMSAAKSIGVRIQVRPGQKVPRVQCAPPDLFSNIQARTGSIICGFLMTQVLLHNNIIEIIFIIYLFI